MPITPEQAKESLSSYKSPFHNEGRDGLKLYLEAIMNNELPQYFLDQFHRRLQYSDDLPEKRLVSIWHPEFPYMKCRGMFITETSAKLNSCIKHQVISDPQVVKAISDFDNRDWEFRKGGLGEVWTTQEEIDFINSTLTLVTQHIEETHGVSANLEEIREQLEVDRAHYRKQFIRNN